MLPDIMRYVEFDIIDHNNGIGPVIRAKVNVDRYSENRRGEFYKEGVAEYPRTQEVPDRQMQNYFKRGY